MGYCPQFDALHEHLTATETLMFYGRIRVRPRAPRGCGLAEHAHSVAQGIPEKRLEPMVRRALRSAPAPRAAGAEGAAPVPHR